MHGLRTRVSLDSPLTHRSISTAPHSRVNSNSRSSKDLQIDPDRSSASSSFKLDSQELLEQAYADNRQLRRRVGELEQSQNQVEANYKRAILKMKNGLETKIDTLERCVIDKNETIRSLKTRIVRLQASFCSEGGPKRFNAHKVESLLGGMKEKLESLTFATKENFCFIREQLELIDGVEPEAIETDCEPSSIQGEL